MKKTALRLLCGLVLTGTLGAVGEKTLLLGGGAGWGAIETRRGVAETAGTRPHPVLALEPAWEDGRKSAAADLFLTFDQSLPALFADETGNYRAVISPGLFGAAGAWARAGRGSARFVASAASDTDPGRDGPLVLRPGKNALLASGSLTGDFSIEFWLYPLNLETGERVVTWTSTLEGYDLQRIRCVTVRNRLEWTFADFFAPPAGSSAASGRKDYVLSSSPLLPRTWSHHLIRFDAHLGLLEYLVDGRLEALEYTTSTGREGGEVLVPRAGDDGSLVLGGRYTGLMDEFRVWAERREAAALARFPAAGGRAESRTLDLGYGSRLLRIDAAGGETAHDGSPRAGRYAGRGNLRFADAASVSLFVRCSDDPYRWEGGWQPFTPGGALPALSGRYVRVAADFYPGGDGSVSPYLEELALVYTGGAPPAPPVKVRAEGRDGAVEVSWEDAGDKSVAGYLVYYGEAPGEYFGAGAAVGGQVRPSPVSVPRVETGGEGSRVSLRLEGLRNGRLYYFAVAAFSDAPGSAAASPAAPGPFSPEVTARPLP
ncbi:MAG: fibronectin type III domain protein [Treponematales bacterium]